MQELMLKLVEDMYPLPGQADPQEALKKKPKRGRPNKRAAACEAGLDNPAAPSEKRPSKAKGRGRVTKASKPSAASPQASSESSEEATLSEAEPARRPPSARVKRRRVNAAADTGTQKPADLIAGKTGSTDTAAATAVIGEVTPLMSQWGSPAFYDPQSGHP